MTPAGRGSDTDHGTGPENPVFLGRISGLFGVRGWVKIFSETDPRENILGYSPWYLRRRGEWEVREVRTGRRQGKAVIALLQGVDGRDTAAELLGAEIAIPRALLEQPGPGEYYWTDLEGLEVVTVDGRELGIVDRLFETGANDVMVIRGERERLVPFVEPDVVREVDLAHRRLVVDWDPDF